MSFAIVKLPNEPIVIVVGAVPIEAHLDPLRSVFSQLDQLATRVAQPIYCVHDASRLYNLAYSDILLWLDEQRSALPGTVRDPRLHPIMVGTNDLLPIAVKKVFQHFSVTMPLYPTIEEALAAIRTALPR